jgi:methionyl-tRNA formyltransferase
MSGDESNPTQRQNDLNLVIMGTGPFAVPMFESLLTSRHRVLGLVTRPDRPVHRRGKPPANPMRELAQRNKVDVFEPESINSTDAHAWLLEQAADLFIACDYGQILSSETLTLARLGGINLHASLLPKYRGAAPINWAIYHGQQETGVTVIHMTPQLDAGPALVQRRIAIGTSETAPELEIRLAALGRDAVNEAIEMLASGKPAEGIPQDKNMATKAPRLKKEDGLVDWSRSAVDIFNQVRAMQPWPTTYTFLKTDGGEPLRLILDRVRPVVENSSSGNVSQTPGTIIVAQGDELIVACGQGCLRLEMVQPAGKRAMTAGEFLRGHTAHPGIRFE